MIFILTSDMKTSMILLARDIGRATANKVRNHGDAKMEVWKP